MSVISLHPKLTIGDHEEAILFHTFYHTELLEHVEVRSIVSNRVLETTVVTSDDVIVFFFRADDNYLKSIQDFLSEAAKKGCKIYSISIARDFRKPPCATEKSQSYDVEEHLRNRSLTRANLSTVASAFSRSVIARIQPTLVKDRMRLFISHRRLDGEEIAAALCKTLRKQAESAFHDLLDIKVGEDAQEKIEENLRNSDAIIFLDTPKTYQSCWIAKELEIAISINLPIVWVKIGTHDPKNRLLVTPLGEPHFVFEDIDSLETEFDPETVNTMIDKAYEISREQAGVVLDHFRELKALAKTTGVMIKQIDKRWMLYEVHIPRPSFRYWQRPMTHLIQLYGRFPKQDDKARLRPVTHKYGYEHPTLGTYYDSALLLAPIPRQNGVITAESDNWYIDSFQDYISSLKEYIVPPSQNERTKRGIIISGAFPDCEPTYQQYLSNAVHAVAQAVLENSGILIFGGHPTFQYPLLNMAKRIRPDGYREAVHLYLSKWFVTDQTISEVEKQSLVFPVPAANSREASLTQMRKTMIKNKEAVALIVMGGKTDDGGHAPGVDEEIALARSVDIPVFLIGSVGGRSGQIAAELDRDGWRTKWNELSAEENRLLMTSLDYHLVAKLIVKSLGF